jgi:hypothetical protein
MWQAVVLGVLPHHRAAQAFVKTRERIARLLCWEETIMIEEQLAVV